MPKRDQKGGRCEHKPVHQYFESCKKASWELQGCCGWEQTLSFIFAEAPYVVGAWYPAMG